jgi:hypothetical protein
MPLSPEDVAFAAVKARLIGMAQGLATADVGTLREQISYARRLSAIASPGPASGESTLACAEVVACELERFQGRLRSFGVLPWLLAQGKPAPKPRRRRAAVRA